MLESWRMLPQSMPALFAPDSGEGVLVFNSFGCTGARKSLRLAMPALAVVLMAAGLSVEASLARADDKPPAPTKGQVNDAKTQLQQLSEQVGQTKAAVEAAESKLPQAEGGVKDAEAAVGKANAAVTAAQAAVATAQAAVDAAQAEVVKANQAVAAQQAQVDQVKTQIDQLLVQVSKLARSAYIDGGQYQSLELILGASTPSDLANQRVAVTRTSHENAQAYTQLMAAKATLAQKLAELKTLQDQVQQRKQDAQAKADDVQARANDVQARANDAQAAVAKAQGAKQAVVDLINQRNQALAQVQVQLKEIRTTYQKLLAQYENAHQGSTRVPSAKNQPMRSGQAVIDWALQWVGKGSMYDGLCLGFVDDAYGARSGRVGRAIDQWYRAKAAGYGHPGDRNPPVGAQVFWWTGNPARHIALYAGGGMVITTGGDGDRVAIVSMSYLDSWGPYIGWAPGYYG